VEVKPRVPFDAVSLDSRIELLREADAAAVSAAERMGVRLPGRYLSLDTIITEKTIINSDGAKVYSKIPRVALDTFITAFHPERGSVQRMYNLGESTGWEGIERWDLSKLLSEEAESLANILLKAEAAKEEQGDVILSPEVVGIVSHESSGHPGEADRILGREAAQAGEAYLQRDSLGLKVGSGAVMKSWEEL
jgi:TldD protein